MATWSKHGLVSCFFASFDYVDARLKRKNTLF